MFFRIAYRRHCVAPALLLILFMLALIAVLHHNGLCWHDPFLAFALAPFAVMHLALVGYAVFAASEMRETHTIVTTKIGVES